MTFNQPSTQSAQAATVEVESVLLEARGLAVGPTSLRAPLLRGVDVQLAAGQLAAVVGPNGAGKSTLLRTLAGLQRPLGGQVLWRGRPLDSWTAAERARLAAVVLTEAANDGLLRVSELVALGRAPTAAHWGLWQRGEPTEDPAVASALELAEISDLAPRRLMTLSDGQRQRARVARALAQGADLLLLDEPTLHLDPGGRAQLMGLLRRIASGGRAVVVVTHEVHLAETVADALWIVAEGGVRAVSAETWQRDGLAERVFARMSARMSAEGGDAR